jgi:hypothetical protein
MAVAEPLTSGPSEAAGLQIVGARVVGAKFDGDKIVGGEIVEGRVIDSGAIKFKVSRSKLVHSHHSEVIAVMLLGLALLLVHLW